MGTTEMPDDNIKHGEFDAAMGAIYGRFDRVDKRLEEIDTFQRKQNDIRVADARESGRTEERINNLGSEVGSLTKKLHILGFGTSAAVFVAIVKKIIGA